MPRRLLLEGTDPHELLVRARDAYGDDVTVAQAERVRGRGVRGMLGKDAYVLTVEVPDEAAVRPAVSGVRDASADADDEIADVAAVSRELRASVTREPAAALAAALPSPQSSDEFGALLARLAHGLDAHGGDDAPVAEEAPPAPPAASQTSAPALNPQPAPQVVPAAAASASVAAVAPAAGSEPRAFVPARFPVADPGTSVIARRIRRGNAHAAVVEDPRVEDLLALGVPDRLLEGEDGRVALSALVRRLDPVPALAAGDLLVVVGDPERSLAVACQVARWHGAPETSVLLAGDAPAATGHGRRIRSAASARTMGARAVTGTAGHGPAVVALGLGPDTDEARAAALLEGFAPRACWAATAASGPQDPVLDALEALGRIDAAALDGVAALREPGRALAGPLPVAWVDGLPATPVMWATRLDAALAARHATRPMR
ncbi:hypothetical protein [Demequina mangrovi]|uniref:Uncharacterized protein n=1 Tax=Demequina mangrovi TaxID=1043493 RepID=A0A1H7A1S2_9MICO|nr:hypothetical protein [Demequina mangrovi]SEJ55780.1 hypothetical protein SAMN05421637_2183 [Demequina mangrovi]